MNSGVIHKIEKIEKMLYMLLNDEQKEEIKQFDVEFFEQMKKYEEDALEREKSIIKMIEDYNNIKALYK